jgi:hypothetical protein
MKRSLIFNLFLSWSWPCRARDSARQRNPLRRLFRQVRSGLRGDIDRAEQREEKEAAHEGDCITTNIGPTRSSLARELHDPVRFPTLTTVRRKSLLPAARVRGENRSRAHRPETSHQITSPRCSSDRRRCTRHRTP